MSKDKAMNKAVGIIKEIAQDINNGAIIVREIRPQELRAVWINADNGKEYSLGANSLRAIIDFNRNDPRGVPVLQFVANQITANEAIKIIERLENLKAFW